MCACVRVVDGGASELFRVTGIAAMSDDKHFFCLCACVCVFMCVRVVDGGASELMRVA